MKKGKGKAPKTYKLDCKVFWKGIKGDRVTYGVNFSDIPAELKKDFGKGKKGHAKVVEDLAKDEEYGSRSLFLSNTKKFIKGSGKKAEKGDSIAVEFAVNVTDKGGVFYNLRNIEIVESEEDEDGWGDSDNTGESVSSEDSQETDEDPFV